MVLLSSIASASDAPKGNPKPEIFHYKLVMSENDEICKPLAKLYEQMLIETNNNTNKDKWSPLPEDEEGVNHVDWTNFETRAPERFSQIGFTEPPTKEIILPNPPGSYPDFYKETVYLVDVFGEGKPRMVSVAGDMQYQKIRILKKDTEYRDIKDSPVSVDVDPAIVDRDASLSGLLQTEKDMNTSIGTWGYWLKKWPNFDKLYQAHMQQEKIWKASLANSKGIKVLSPFESDFLHPYITGAGPVSEKIFMKANKAYFILNGNSILGRLEDGNILVFTPTPQNYDDVCYIALTSKKVDE
jgi:hypothetical protein